MKIILWPTNINQKLAANRFCHIDRAPGKMPTRQQMESTVIRIEVADKSHPPVTVQLQHVDTFRLAELTNLQTWPSHGMDTSEFILEEHLKNKITADTMLAVYYYKKIN